MMNSFLVCNEQHLANYVIEVNFTKRMSGKQNNVVYLVILMSYKYCNIIVVQFLHKYLSTLFKTVLIQNCTLSARHFKKVYCVYSFIIYARKNCML